MKMVRTTLSLPEEDVKQIKMLAAIYGLTMSKVVQESVKMRFSALPGKSSDAAKVFGSVSRPDGFKGIYKKRSDLYEDRLKKQLPSD